MNAKARFVLVIALALLAGLALAAMTQAMPGSAPLTPGGSPTVVAYQGEVQASGTPYTGDGFFKFAVVNAASDAAYWSNDGSSTGGGEPTTAVGLAVSEGLFSVLLGDTTLGGMTQALTADVFSQPDCYLRVWFSTSFSGPFDQLTPDTRIAAVPYALQAQSAADADTVDGLHASAFATDTHAHAPGDITPQGSGSGLDADTVDGLHASQLGAHYRNVVVVAKSGGDYSSVQAAIDSVADAAAGNPYLVWVAPGVYSETVMMKPYIHLQGAGQEATVITSTVNSSAWPPTEATLVLTSNASLRDLTVDNGGAGDYNAALLATAGATRTLATDVTARTQGDGTRNCAIVLNGSGVGILLQQVTALGENGSDVNYGLCNFNGAAATLRGGFFTGRGGDHTRGIFNYSATLEAENTTVLAENGSAGNFALANHEGATATLRGGSFTGRGGTDTTGIYNTISTTLEIESVIVLAENGSNINIGLQNLGGAAATLRGGSFTGRGGTYARGIYNRTSGTALETESVTALGENGTSTSYGLYNNLGAAATLRGGSFTGRGGTFTRGIYSYGSDTTLEAGGVTALGENASDENYGLTNWAGAAAVLRGGSFTGRAGTTACGIDNADSDTTLETESVTALGENGSSVNRGLYSHNGAEATLRGSSFTGSGGISAIGVNNADSGSTLKAESVTALGEGGGNNYGLFNGTDNATADVTQGVLDGATNSVFRSTGTVTVTNSRLVGGVFGSVTCVAVSHGTTFYPGTCP